MMTPMLHTEANFNLYFSYKLCELCVGNDCMPDQKYCLSDSASVFSRGLLNLLALHDICCLIYIKSENRYLGEFFSYLYARIERCSNDDSFNCREKIFELLGIDKDVVGNCVKNSWYYNSDDDLDN